MLNKDNKTQQEQTATLLKAMQSALDCGPVSVPCVSLPITGWHPLLDTAMQKEASAIIEGGKILTFPNLTFTLTREEESFLRSDCVAPRARCIKFSSTTQHIWGVADKETNTLTPSALLKRYAEATHDFVARLFPGYVQHLVMGNTSFRPVDAKRRIKSLRHDDHLLHIDAFPSRPTKGMRVLRIFTNINPEGKPRVLRVGESFESLVARFQPKLHGPIPGSALLMRLLMRTRSLRMPYDHYMLQLHDAMKSDVWYQAEAPQTTISLPAGSSWLMFSDQVPHATVSGQYILEQAFFIPPQALDDPTDSPLYALERLVRRKLA